MAVPGIIENKYLRLWLPAIGLHALHQLEESISFFQWYHEHESAIPSLLRIVSQDHAAMIIQHPAYFIAASVAQISVALMIAFFFRHRVRATRLLVLLYLSGLSFFLLWHIVTSYFARSYAPIMVTCIGGLYFLPIWLRELLAPARTVAQPSAEG